MRKNELIGILRLPNGKKPGIATAIPGCLFARNPFPQLLDSDQQGGKNAGFQQKTDQCDGDHRQEVGSRQLLIGGEICVQQIDYYDCNGNAE